MDQEKYTLSWHTYPDHLRGMMQEMMTSDDFTDVTLVCDDKKTIKAHKSILSACSPVFKDIFQMETQNNHPVIYLRGIQYPEIESILHFMYLGEANIFTERLDEVIRVAKNLEVKVLKDKDIDESESQYDFMIEEATQQEHFDNSNMTVNEAEIFVCKKEQIEPGSKYPCGQCDKTFPRKQALWQHKKSVHEGVKYACNQCEYLTIYQSHLKRHIKRRHL